MNLKVRPAAPAVRLRRSYSRTEFYITDHLDDPRETSQQLRKLYGALKGDGFCAVRYDWRWAKLEPQAGTIDQQQLAHYSRAKGAMDEVGLGAPIVILSTPPKWAMDLYQQDKSELFFAAYRRYAEAAAIALRQAGGKRVRTVQILNELNNRIYTNVAPVDIAKLCDITREAFHLYYGKVELLATVLALPRRPGVAAVLPFLRHNRLILEQCFDIIGVDYYPGTWHWPTLKELFAKPKSLTVGKTARSLWTRIVQNTTLLEAVFTELAAWRTDYELAEIGWTSYRFLGGEAAQAASSLSFLGAYQSMLARLRARGAKLPSRFGVYAARDEVQAGPLQLLIKQQRWGLYDDALRPKHVVESGVWRTVLEIKASHILH